VLLLSLASSKTFIHIHSQIIRDPTHFWDAHTMKNIIYACIILHNIIVEDKRHTYQNNIDYDNVGNDMSTFEVSSCAHPSFISKYLQRRVDVHDNRKPYQFQADLIGHIWECFKK